jgi:hypothetical protein
MSYFPNFFIGCNIPGDLFRLKEVGVSRGQVRKHDLGDTDNVFNFPFPFSVRKPITVRRVPP